MYVIKNLSALNLLCWVGRKGENGENEIAGRIFLAIFVVCKYNMKQKYHFTGEDILLARD